MSLLQADLLKVYCCFNLRQQILSLGVFDSRFMAWPQVLLVIYELEQVLVYVWNGFVLVTGWLVYSLIAGFCILV